jgi:hypothetical protein
MEMFLMGCVLSLLGVAVSAALFAAATRDERAEQRTRAAQAVAPAAPRFFTDQASAPAPPVPLADAATAAQIEALLLRIERHVRLEQAAAESFLRSPTSQSLHGRTASPLRH